jgi:hypothetical protein
MIKDELKKLETLETCVSDTEIEQFIIPEDPPQKHVLGYSDVDATSTI